MTRIVAPSQELQNRGSRFIYSVSCPRPRLHSKYYRMAGFSSPNAYNQFARVVQTERRWIFDGPAKEFLDAVRTTSADHIISFKANERFYRAQLGSASVDESDFSFMGDEKPLSESRMVPESKYIKAGGRANPMGFAYLYLATRAETALAEMRPWQGESLTLALFELTREIKIIMCHPENENPIERIENQAPSLNQINQYVWNDISRAFARPVGKDDQQSTYIPTQILAEVFKAAGLDGLVYHSGLDRGGNIVLFDTKAAKFRRSYLYRLKKVRYDFEAVGNYAINITKNGKSEERPEFHSETPDA